MELKTHKEKNYTFYDLIDGEYVFNSKRKRNDNLPFVKAEIERTNKFLLKDAPIAEFQERIVMQYRDALLKFIREAKEDSELPRCPFEATEECYYEIGFKVI